MPHHLVGVSELAAILGVSRQRVHQIIEEAKDFPAPEAELSAGKVWSRAAVDAWRASHPERLVEAGARPLMYDFSDASRRVIGRAQDEARRLGHAWLGTEHLALAMMSTDSPDVLGALAALGIERGAFEAEVVSAAPPGQAPDVPVPFTERAMAALRAAIASARSGGSQVAEPRHIAVAVVADQDGLAARAMTRLAKVDLEAFERSLTLSLDKANAPVTVVSGERTRARAGHDVSCSFCNKPARQVHRLIAGPGVYICNECVSLCDDILDEDRVARPVGAARQAVATRLEAIANEVAGLRKILIE